MKYLLYFAMAVTIFFLGFYIGNKKVTELQEETAVPRSRVAENKNSDPSIISRNLAESVKKNSTPRSDQTEQKVTESQEENNVPAGPTMHPDENIDEIGLDATNSFENYNQMDELRYSMEDEGVAEEDIENMLGSSEESDRSGYISGKSETSSEELEDEIIASFIDAGVSPEDSKVMLEDLMKLRGIEKTSDSSDKPAGPPLPDADQNEGIDNNANPTID